MASESEKEKLKGEVAEYQSTTSTLQQDLKLEQESKQQTSANMEQQLGSVKDELDTIQANATSLEQQNKVGLRNSNLR